MKPEKRFLIHELLDGDDPRREATLLAGGRLLRRRRWRRAAGQGLALVAAITVVAGFVLRMHAPRPSAVASTPASPSQVPSLTDDELLALFPNTPVGLATVNGKKLLIFPRPGDEERFVGHF